MIVIKKLSLKFNEIIQEHLFVIFYQDIFVSCTYQDQINEQASEVKFLKLRASILGAKNYLLTGVDSSRFCKEIFANYGI